MIPTDLLQRSAAAISTTLNRYSLLIPSCQSPIDVENLTGMEALSENYYYSVMFTSPDKDITPDQMLRKVATLTMGTGELMGLSGQKIVHGYITDFRRLTGSADQVTYLIFIEPRLTLLDKQYRSHRFFVNKSVPEVVSQILDEHGFQGWEYEFSLKQEYPKREQINQYQESDLQFVRRLLSEIGIFYYFSLHPDTQTEIIRFGDSQSAYSEHRQLPLNSPSGLEDNAQESIWGLNITHNVVEAGVVAKDYNHREAQRVLRSVQADMTRGDGENISYGQVYHYRPRHPDSGDKFAPETETANFYARLDHERFLARQTLISGLCNDAFLIPGHVLSVTESGLPTLPAQLQHPVLITRINVSASRSSAFQASLNAVPYSETLCWRPALLPRPKVSGTMTARVTSAKDNDIYAWQDESGLYRVVFDADEEGKARGLESMPVRLAKPYGGDMYGFHFPLIQGTEVAIAFREGDPDQPYIAHALHDSRHVDHVTEKNSTRNVIRTAGLNKLRMEDKRGEEHIKLSTEYGGKTQLNLGHNVDTSRTLRGEGAELRTDKHVSIRGGAGVFISADKQPKSQGGMLEMSTAVAELQSALQMVTALAQSTKTSGALEADAQSQQKLAETLNQLREAGLLFSAPAGIAAATAQNIQLSAGQSVTATAGKNIDMSIVKRFTVAAGEAISLFAHRMGLKVYAAKGDVDIQAQTDAIRIQAKKDLSVNSVDGEVIVNAANGITLTSKGGAYIKLKDGAIEIGAPARLSLKSSDIAWGGRASLEKALAPTPVSDPQFTSTMNGEFRVLDQVTQQPKPFIPYRIELADGEFIRGVTDENGYTQPHYGLNSDKISLHYE